MTNILSNIKEKIIKNKEYLLAILIGILVFYFIFGFKPLNVLEDSWIYNGYLEKYITQHYAGWLNFRASDWSFPLGVASNLSNTAITFTDSLPMVSILFKLLSPILPETFQFFGLYILFCLIMQAIASFKLLKLFIEDKICIFIGVVLLTFSPILLERAFRHTALASHWLIMFSLYYYFYYKKNKYQNVEWQIILLNTLAIGIHPYFLPMTFGITLASCIDCYFNTKNLMKSISVFLISAFTTLLLGYLIGAIGYGVGFAAGGFGVFSMNLNSIINPYSLGIDTWSIFLKNRSQILGNYDGFNYLGLGVILAFVYIISYSVYQRKNIIFYVKQVVKRHKWLFIMCVGLFLFAISNVVTLNENIILEYKLPSKVLELCSIFRASSRMFYPVFYLLFLIVILFFVRRYLIKTARYALVLILLIQVIDMTPMIKMKNEFFHNIDQQAISNGFGTDEWEYLGKNYNQLLLFHDTFNYDLGAFCGKYGLKSNVSISARVGNIDRIGPVQNAIKNGDLDNNTIYLSPKEELVDGELSNIPHDFVIYDLNYFVAVVKDKGNDGISVYKNE